ncbi:hypothetical protein BVC80_1741g32 [Macleaya cordata]|uniref:Uncharacterized protein n=1 Tax=Macleaya cordata TaxID=56857 RepID=A0A200QKK9_MACCD|nr:hypothetical protein BVC80_1741g32 [Macleaya cordata]
MVAISHNSSLEYLHLRRLVSGPFTILSILVEALKASVFTTENMRTLQGLRYSSQIMHAIGSGLEASISNQGDIVMNLKTAKVVVESRDDDKIQVRVDLTGKETQKVFDDVLTNLARSAPPIPGFRKMKGGNILIMYLVAKAATGLLSLQISF